MQPSSPALRAPLQHRCDASLRRPGRPASAAQLRPVRTAARPAERIAAGIPPVAVLAALLAIVGAPSSAIVVISGVSQRSAGSGGGADWWLYLFLVIPLLEAAGAWWLLTGRGWLPLVLTCVPGTLLFGYVLWARLAGPADLRPGWMAFALVAPLIALVLAVLPPTRRWVSARREFAVAGATA